jgi:hypothetical protein
VGGCGLNSSGTGQSPPVGCCQHGNEISGSIKAGNFLTSRETISFSRRTILHGVRHVYIYMFVCLNT